MAFPRRSSAGFDSIAGYFVMNLSGTSSITAVLIIAFGLFVMYTQWKNWFDSNLPIIFYVVFFSFTESIDGGVVPFARFIRPRVEVELAFILDRPLKGPGVTTLDVLDATRWVTPALEILDARVQMSDPETGHLRTIVDTISDNAADAGIVVGGRAVRPDALDLRRVGAALYVNEAIEETGLAAGVLGHPANGVAWLANKLAPYDEHLPPGQVILAGSFTRPVFVGEGDTVHADFGDLGSVTCRFR